MVACAFANSLLFHRYNDTARVQWYVRQSPELLRTSTAYGANAAGLCPYRRPGGSFCGYVQSQRACRQIRRGDENSIRRMRFSLIALVAETNREQSQNWKWLPAYSRTSVRNIQYAPQKRTRRFTIANFDLTRPTVLGIVRFGS